MVKKSYSAYDHWNTREAVEIDNCSATDVPVNFTDHSSNFRLKFDNDSHHLIYLHKLVTIAQH